MLLFSYLDYETFTDRITYGALVERSRRMREIPAFTFLLKAAVFMGALLPWALGACSDTT